MCAHVQLSLGISSIVYSYLASYPRIFRSRPTSVLACASLWHIGKILGLLTKLLNESHMFIRLYLINKVQFRVLTLTIEQIMGTNIVPTPAWMRRITHYPIQR